MDVVHLSNSVHLDASLFSAIWIDLMFVDRSFQVIPF